MAIAAQKEIDGSLSTAAKAGAVGACQSLNALLPGAGVVCASLGASAVDIFTSFMVIDDKINELAGAAAAETLANKLQGQWGSLVTDITKDLAVCKTNGNTGTCGSRTANRVAKAVLASRPLDAGDGMPGTLGKEGQLSPAILSYAKAVIYAAFGNEYRSNKNWSRYQELLGMWEGKSGDQVKLDAVVRKIEAVALQLQSQWDQGVYGQLEALKEEQAKLLKKMNRPSADLSQMFAPDITTERLDRIADAGRQREEREEAEQQSGGISTTMIGLGVAAVAALALSRGK